MHQKESKYSILIPVLEIWEAPDFLIQAVNNTIALEFGEVGYDRYDPRTFLHHLLHDEMFSGLEQDTGPLTSNLIDILQDAADSYLEGLFYFSTIFHRFDQNDEFHVMVKEYVSYELDMHGFNHPYKFSEGFISFGKCPPEVLYEVASDYLMTLRCIQKIVMFFVWCGWLGPHKNIQASGLNLSLQVTSQVTIVFCKYCHRVCDARGTTCKRHKFTNQAEYKRRLRRFEKFTAIFEVLYNGEAFSSLAAPMYFEMLSWFLGEIDKYLPELSRVTKTISANNITDFLSQLFQKIDAPVLAQSVGQPNIDAHYFIKSMLRYEAWEQAFAKSKGRGRPAKFDREDAIRLQESGYTVKEIAAKFGVSPAAVSKKIKPNHRR